jgi:mannose/fructose/N-acetylgalactosamine-specific phosphotransferase system component IIB
MNFKFPWQKKKLQFPLVRVDDRLLHGQVVVGWGQQLSLKRFVLVSERLGQDAAYASALKNLVPEDMTAAILSLGEAAKRWEEGDFAEPGTMVVLESAGDALKLFKQGASLKSLTLGGLHFREGSEEYLPYVFLSRWDKLALEELMNNGVRVECQDLPTTKPSPYKGSL